LLAVAVCTVVALGDPARDGWFPPCPFKAATGLDCPGCGTARGLHALTGGDLGTAVDHNVLMVLALPFLLASWLAWAGRSVGITTAQVDVRSGPGLYGLAGLVLVWWVVRNIPVEPLAWLASDAG
jgi:hypothetical protein